MKNKNNKLTPMEKLMIKEAVRKESERVREETMNKAFLYMLAIPLNVLFNDYWGDSAKEKAPEFIESVISLYEAVQQGVVDEQDLAEVLEDLAGVKVEADWLKKKEVK
jgi:hypothetical protein